MDEPAHKSLVRQAVYDYLSETAPRELDEFAVVFDGIYDTINRKLREDAEVDEPFDRNGIAFEPALLAGTTISIACWIAAKLIAATAADSIQRDLLPHLDLAERRLTDWTRKPEMVHKLRLRVEGILKRFADRI